MTEENQPEQKPEERPEDKPAAAAPAGDDLAALKKAYGIEMKTRRELEAKLAEREKSAMTDQERAVAAAREEGRAEALTSAGKRLALAEFRASAAGKIPNIDALLKVMDPANLLGEDGEPDTQAIAAMVAEFAVKADSHANGNGNGKSDLPPGLSFPGGVRQPAETNGDWLRDVASR